MKEMEEAHCDIDCDAEFCEFEQFGRELNESKTEERS
jgi:hypothetical protein